MVQYLRETLVDKKRWLLPDTFTKGLVTCQSLPGAIVVNLASYCGYQIRGLSGLVVAFCAFLLPSFVLMLLFASFYKESRDLSLVKSAFNGLEVVVVAIVINAAWRFCSDRIKGDIPAILLAAISSTMLMLRTSPLLVIALTGLIGMLIYTKGSMATFKGDVKGITLRDTALITLTFLMSYGFIYLFWNHVFDLSNRMTKIALLSFGGVYTALPIMYHEIVESMGWMDSKTFMDGIALGQVTPGPILINATFVGYIKEGLIGAVAATFAIFAPGPVLLSLAMPFIDKIEASPYFKGATKGMIAAFAGLLIFVAIKFALAVHWDLLKALFFGIAFLWLIWKNNVLIVALVGAGLSMLLF
jgi:chromate transporter